MTFITRGGRGNGRRRGARNPVRPLLQGGLLAALVLLGPAARAHVTPAELGAYRKAARGAVRDVRKEARLAGKALRADLQGALLLQAVGEQDAAGALSAAVSAVTRHRDDLEDAVATALTGLAAEGAALLGEDGEGFEPVGRDFAAGGRGLWDDAVTDVEALLDKADDKLRKDMDRFVKRLLKTADKAGTPTDVRWVVPEHGMDHWLVLPPALAEREGGAEALDIRPPQVLIAARIVTVEDDDQFDIGFRFGGAAADVSVSSRDGEALTLGQLMPDLAGRASGSFRLTGLESAGSPLAFLLSSAQGDSRTRLLSVPRLVSPDATADVVSELRQNLKLTRSGVSKDGAQAVKELTQRLGSHVQAVKKGFASVDLAYRTGFGDLQAAREAISASYLQNLTNCVGNAMLGLLLRGLDDSVLGPDLAADGQGVYAQGFAAARKVYEARMAAVDRRFASFLRRLGKLNGKLDAGVTTLSILGFRIEITPPVVSLAEEQAGAPRVVPFLADVLTLRIVPTVGETQLSVLIDVQADPAVDPTPVATAVQVPDGGTVVLGGLTVDDGGTAETEVPLLGDLPVAGWFFRAGAQESAQRNLMVFVTPQLVEPAEN